MATVKYSIGTPTANSYVSTASANTYFNERFLSDSWDNLSDATNATAAATIRGNLLIQATKEIDRTYRFFQSKYNTGLIGATDYQALEFPRTCHTDADGNLYIDEDVKTACYEQALWILQRATPRKTETEEVIERRFVGSEAYTYLKPYVTLQAKTTGAYPWQ